MPLGGVGGAEGGGEEEEDDTINNHINDFCQPIQGDPKEVNILILL